MSKHQRNFKKGRKVKRTPSVSSKVKPLWAYPLPARSKNYGRKGVPGDWYHQAGYREWKGYGVEGERLCLLNHETGPMVIPQPIKARLIDGPLMKVQTTAESNESPVPECMKRWPLFDDHRIEERLSFSGAPLRFYPTSRVVNSLEHDYLAALVKRWVKHGGVIKEGPTVRMWEWQVVFSDAVRKHVDTLRNRASRARQKAEETGLRYFAYKALVSKSERTYFKHTALPRPYPLVSECKGKKAEQVKKKAAHPDSIKSGPFNHWDCEDRFLNRLFLPEQWAYLSEGWGDGCRPDGGGNLVSGSPAE